MKRVATLVAALVLLVASAPSAASPGWRCGERDRDSERERVRPRAGHEDVRQWPWDCAISLDDGRVLILHLGLSDPCHGIERYKVRYFPQRIVVKVFQGIESSDGGSACPAVIVPVSLRIELAEDRAGRRVVDGYDR